MRNSSCEASAIRDWRCMRRARCPAWLWSIDGTPDPVGQSGRRTAVRRGQRRRACQTRFGPADPHRRQVAQLAGRLPATARSGWSGCTALARRSACSLTCGCSRLEFPDGGHGILMAAAETRRPRDAAGRAAAASGRRRRSPIAAFARDGMFVGASDAARPLLGFRNLSEAGLDEARSDALKQGRVETPVGIGHMVLQRVGSGADIGLVALIEPGAMRLPPIVRHCEAASQPVAPAADLPAPDYEQRGKSAKRRPNSR